MDDWKEGDTALCVKSGPWTSKDNRVVCGGPQSGGFYFVREAKIMKGRPDKDDLFLNFGNWPADFWHHSAFRKLREVEPDAEDIEIIRILKRGMIGATKP
jgi:hypothetical protein